MSEYIEREAIMQKFADHVKRSNNSDFAEAPTWNQAVQIVEDFPAADVVPVVKSKWADNRVAFYRGCPECGAFVRADLDEVFLRDFPSAVGRLNYCPNCGTDMRPTSMSGANGEEI